MTDLNLNDVLSDALMIHMVDVDNVDMIEMIDCWFFWIEMDTDWHDWHDDVLMTLVVMNMNSKFDSNDWIECECWLILNDVSMMTWFDMIWFWRLKWLIWMMIERITLWNDV